MFNFWIDQNPTNNVVVLTGVSLRFYEEETEKLYRIVRPLDLSHKYSFCTLEGCTFHFYNSKKRLIFGTETILYSKWKGSEIVRRNARSLTEVPIEVDYLIRKTYAIFKLAGDGFQGVIENE